MNATRFTFPSDLEIAMERVFDAPAERVFKVCTDPNLIPQWWGPRRYTTTVEKDDVTLGGTWRYISRDSKGNEFAFNGVYREIAPAKRVVRTFEFEPMQGHVSVETATFEEQGSKTTLRVTSLFQTVEDRDGMLNSGMEEGASESWDRLAELLAAMKPGISIERTFKATPQKVWEMWTTKEGIEKWSAPHPWVAKVKHLDVRPGGLYESTFTDGKQSIRNHGTYTEVVFAKRLAWTDVFDMLPDVPPYNLYGVMEMQLVDGGTKVTFNCSALHSEEWTRMATEGWTVTFGQLAKALEQ